MEDQMNEPPPVLLPCSICARTFRPEVLDRHTKVCEKTASKKRRVFDSFKSRVSGTELEEFLGPAPLPGQAPKKPEKSPVKRAKGPPKWKETHENLIAVLRAARGVAPADPAAAAAVFVKNTDNEQCPSCGRFFGPRAFDRHVQFCKEKTARIRVTPTKVSQAQERLEARTKYKAPLSLKSKMTTKEKYSPMLPRKGDSSETISAISKTSGVNSFAKPTRTTPARQTTANFSRQSPTRCSERQRSVSPKKPLSNSKVTAHSKHSAQPKIKDSLRDTEDLRPKTGMKMSAHQDKIRSCDRKLIDSEDSCRGSNRLSTIRNARRSSVSSSDEGNETDPSRERPPMGGPIGRRTDDEPRSSRKSKIRLPALNSLSVNDESFGIKVAPCPRRSQSNRKPKELPPLRARLNLVIPKAESPASKIPKPVTKTVEVRKNENDGQRKTILGKWQNETEILRDLDFSDLDDLRANEGSEREELSQSSLWDLVGEEPPQSDDSIDIPEHTPDDAKEDECIVLHLVEPQKLADDDDNMDTKLSVSEPCFKTNYPDPGPVLDVIKRNSSVFVFGSPSKRALRRNPWPKRRKLRKVKEVKRIPKKSAIRERTFLANDFPIVKRRKLATNEESKRPNSLDSSFGARLRDDRKLKGLEGGKRVKNFEYFEIGADPDEREMIEGEAKGVICYSDEEFEELRKKKEERFSLVKPETTAKDENLLSIEVLRVKSPKKIVEDEIVERSIDVEDFIVSKPDRLLTRSGNLENLFPKAPKTELKTIESSTIVQLNYVRDSLYDLKDSRTRETETREKLPTIEVSEGKVKKKEKTMSSLVQIWKARRETVQNAANWFQTALLPLVLTQKLAEVAEQFDKSKTKDDSYDPFEKAERQMLALLSWPSTADLKTDKSATSPSRLETSPTSAFSKYPAKDDKKTTTNAKDDSNQKTVQKKKEYSPMYSAADDWEQIFEQHFDLNRNEMNEKRSVKSALDGLANRSSEKSPTRHNRSDMTESSLIGDFAYTSTPKKSGSRLSATADSTFDGRKSPCKKAGRTTSPDERGRRSNRNSGVSLSSLSFCSQASDTTLADEEIMRTNLEIIGIGKPTPRTTKRRFARSQSVLDERNKMLFAKTFDHNFSSSDENEILPTINDGQDKFSPTHSYPKSVPSRFHRSQSAMDGRLKGDGDHSEDRELGSSPEGSKNRKAKMSGDSAYSSLNRRSPRSGIRSSNNHLQEDRLSSSGSEHSLPPLNNDHPLKPISLNFDGTSSTIGSKKDQPYKMSKFCHECGSKYPVAVAKFCCECGVRRLII